MASLDNPRARLGRADEHLEALSKEWHAFRERKPYVAVSQAESDALVFYMQVRENPPLRLGLLFGDFLHNLRSALDNLVHELILLNGATPGRTTGFPVFDTERSFKAVGIKRIKGVTGRHAAAIESVQPYPGRDEPVIRALALLNSLATVDKHKLIHPVFLNIGRSPDEPNIQEFTHGGIPLKIEVITPPFGARLDDGAEVGRFRLLTGEGAGDWEMEVQGKISAGIAFGDMNVRLEALPQLGGHVRGIVEWFAPDFG